MWTSNPFPAVFSPFGLIAAEQSEQQHRRDNSAVCTKELEEIVYQPESVTLAYFTRISEGIQVCWSCFLPDSAKHQLLFKLSKNKYNVNVEVFDAFDTWSTPEIIPTLKNTLTKDDRFEYGINYCYRQHERIRYVFVILMARNWPSTIHCLRLPRSLWSTSKLTCPSVKLPLSRIKIITFLVVYYTLHFIKI